MNEVLKQLDLHEHCCDSFAALLHRRVFGNPLDTTLIYGLILISYSDNFIASEGTPLVKLVVLNKNYPK